MVDRFPVPTRNSPIDRPLLPHSSGSQAHRLVSGKATGRRFVSQEAGGSDPQGIPAKIVKYPGRPAPVAAAAEDLPFRPGRGRKGWTPRRAGHQLRLETKYPRLRTPVALVSRFGEWSVGCWGAGPNTGCITS